MAYPFFALSKTAWKRPLIYKTESVSIEIGPGPRGVATIYDKEVLLYIASLLVSKLDAGEAVAQDFYFTAHDLFRVTGVNGSARSYSRLSDALERLQGTQRSEEHTSELQSLMRNSYAVFCLKKKNTIYNI